MEKHLELVLEAIKGKINNHFRVTFFGFCFVLGFGCSLIRSLEDEILDAFRS